MTNKLEQAKFLDSRGNIVYLRSDFITHKRITFDGTLDYLSWHEGDLHRVDGPAVVWNDGTTWWALDGSTMSFQDWKFIVRRYHETEEDYLLMLLKL